MTVANPLGTAAAARKYDILTALGSMALANAPSEQRVVLRLMVAITARYNWASDTLAVAQTELARMWSVDERTVKRMMAEYRNRGWLRLKRPAARGRVAEYGLQIDALLNATRADWSRVGRDFEARLAPPETADPPRSHPTIVPFPGTATAPPPPSGQLWPRMLERLRSSDPATARAWLEGVREAGIEAGVLHLAVRGRYQANYLRTHLMPVLLAAARAIDPQIEVVEISAQT